MILFSNLQKAIADTLRDASQSVEIYVPFVSPPVLDELLRSVSGRCRVSLVTTWKLPDLILGVSSLETYGVCRRHGVFMFLNQRLHLKSYLADYSRLLTGSANLSRRALGNLKTGSHETLVSLEKPSQEYLVFLARIRQEASLVTPALHAKFIEVLATCDDQLRREDSALEAAQEKLDVEVLKRDFFLISELPMSRSFEDLHAVLLGAEDFDEEVLANARHDIAKYGLDAEQLSRFSDFFRVLEQRFFEHPFIERLASFIDRPTRFGAIKEWVQRNCTDVPVPSRRDITGNVQVLYFWLENLGRDRFSVSQPNHSQIIGPRTPPKQ